MSATRKVAPGTFRREIATPLALSSAPTKRAFGSKGFSFCTRSPWPLPRSNNRIAPLPASSQSNRAMMSWRIRCAGFSAADSAYWSQCASQSSCEVRDWLDIFAPSYREKVKATLMVAELDQAGLEAGPNQQRPKVALVVIHFVIVHFHLWAKAETKGGELQERFSAPGRDVNEKDAC